MHAPTPSRRRRAIGAVGLGLALALGAALVPATPGAAQEPPPGTGSTVVEPTPICAQPEGNARFVRFIYLNILFRCPSAADVTYWTGRLDGGLGRGAFALQVDMSDENLVGNNVAPLYGGILGRDATPQEIADGVAHIRANRWDGLLIAELAASDEFYEAFEPEPGTDLTKDEAWVDEVYQNIVDRPVDEGSLEYWIGTFDGESSAAERFRVTRTLERSTENAASWIFGVYFAGVNRPPSGGDIGFWTEWLLGAGRWRAFQMWTSVLSSPEGYARAQTQPSPEMMTTVEGRVSKR